METRLKHTSNWYDFECIDIWVLISAYRVLRPKGPFLNFDEHHVCTNKNLTIKQPRFQALSLRSVKEEAIGKNLTDKI